MLSVGLCVSSRCGSSEVDGSSTTTAEPTPVICSPANVVSGLDGVGVAVADSAVVTAAVSVSLDGEAGTGDVRWSTILDTCRPITRVALMSTADHGLSASLGLSAAGVGFSSVVCLSVVVVCVLCFSVVRVDGRSVVVLLVVGRSVVGLSVGCCCG